MVCRSGCGAITLMGLIKSLDKKKEITNIYDIEKKVEKTDNNV